MKITNVTMSDLPAILAIEQMGFNNQEAGTEKQYPDRIEKLADTFLVAKVDNKVAGFIVGPAAKEPYVEDWMYEKTPHNLEKGGNQIIFTIAVDPHFQGQGVGSKLLAAIEDIARKHHRKTIALTSRDKNVPFYLKNDFVNMGVAESEHAGETWYNMLKKISNQ
ncbi:GNAT family N-acetyltransferase [Companilactobacillus furfuricola]|uniref:GNAT family N-acetyltransferase n=1 Tax=Companilactobacillus furfuricola TaxID=1462575 RepID=UPI000F78B6B7|nr:GNAT family N-acetyltransferase [Companilactobacillus furfuricola]